MEFIQEFDNEEKCIACLIQKQWPSGPVCDKCGTVGHAFKLADARKWRRSSYGANFSAAAGTPMERTSLPLRTWFAATWLIGTSSKGVSSVVVSRQLGTSYKTAWFLRHRIRKLLVEGDDMLGGVVEVDETYIGGKRQRDAKSKRDDDDDQPKGRGASRKMMTLAAGERDGCAKARKGRTRPERTIARAVIEWLDRSAIIVVNELPAYRWIGRRFLAHLSVNHGKGEWSRRILWPLPAPIRTR